MTSLVSFLLMSAAGVAADALPAHGSAAMTLAAAAGGGAGMRAAAPVGDLGSRIAAPASAPADGVGYLPGADVDADAARRSPRAADTGGPSRAGRLAAAFPSGSWVLPGREVDARVATIAMRLASAGVARCPARTADPGLVLQHLSQFERADRLGMVAALALDRGPAVIAVVPGGPAAGAGVLPGDVLVAVDGASVPPELGLADPFDAARAHARADQVQALLARPGARTLTLWRRGETVRARIDPVPSCPSLVRLARSGQRNAYADGRHVFVTTGLVGRLANDDELAFVLAHEMAHNILGHAAAMRGGEVKRGLGRTLGRSGAIVRAAEAAADALGGELMLDAGYDPVRGAEALRRVEGADLGFGLFDAHAPTDTRIAAMRALAAARAPR